MYETIKAAYEHKGFSFVHVIQRCPVFQSKLVEELTSNRDGLCLVNHEDGIGVDEEVAKTFKNSIEHDPFDINAAR